MVATRDQILPFASSNFAMIFNIPCHKMSSPYSWYVEHQVCLEAKLQKDRKAIEAGRFGDVVSWVWWVPHVFTSHLREVVVSWKKSRPFKQYELAPPAAWISPMLPGWCMISKPSWQCFLLEWWANETRCWAQATYSIIFYPPLRVGSMSAGQIYKDITPKPHCKCYVRVGWPSRISNRNHGVLSR